MSVKTPNSFINCFSPNSNSFFSSSKTPGRGGGKKLRQFLLVSKSNSSSGRLCLDGVSCFNRGSCRHPGRMVRNSHFVRAHPLSPSPPHSLSCPNHLGGCPWGTTVAAVLSPSSGPWSQTMLPVSHQASQRWQAPAQLHLERAGWRETRAAKEAW